MARSGVVYPKSGGFLEKRQKGGSKGPMDDIDFSGKYYHNIDAKGRIIIPSKLKKDLGENPVVSLGLDGCLDVYIAEDWKAFVNQLKSLPSMLAEVREMRRILLANASTCEIDKQGRILIPSELRSAAGIEKEAVFVGVGNKVELWNKETYEAKTNGQDLAAMAAKLANMGINF